MKKTQEYPDGRMSTSGAAQYLGFAAKTLSKMRTEGTGPTYVKRGRVFYFKDDLDVWLQAGRITSTSESKATKRMGEIVAMRGKEVQP